VKDLLLFVVALGGLVLTLAIGAQLPTVCEIPTGIVGGLGTLAALNLSGAL
jgi:hypothetical protein